MRSSFILTTFLIGSFLAGCAGGSGDIMATKVKTPARRALAGLPEIEEVKIKDTLAHLIKTHHKELDLQALGFYGESVKKDDLLILKSAESRHLRKLNMTGLYLSDDDIEPIADLQLQELILTKNNVRDLHALAKMKTLLVFTAQDTNLNGEAIKRLGMMPVLRELSIGRTPVTDRDLAGLYQSKSLRVIDVGGCTNISAAGIRALNSKLPHVLVVHKAAPNLEEKRNFDKLRQIRNGLDVHGDPEQADKALVQVIASWENEKNADPVGLGRAYELRAECQMKLHQFHEAIGLQSKGIALLKKKSADFEEIPHACVRLGEMFEHTRDYKSELSVRTEAENFWQNSKVASGMDHVRSRNKKRIAFAEAAVRNAEGGRESKPERTEQASFEREPSRK